MKFWLKIFRLFIGLFIVSFGITMTINANIGLPPWDVLHIGITKIVDITMGQAIISVSILLTILSMLLREKVGIGTIANMFFIGILIDMINSMNIVPKPDNFLLGFIMLNVGLVIFAIGTAIYISCELGCGSKDGLTMAISRITNHPVKYIRATLEICAVIIGIIMGGNFNLGTIYSALVFGYFMQISFKLLKFDAIGLRHMSIKDMFENIYSKNY